MPIHSRFEQILPPQNGKMQAELTKLKHYTNENEMQINKKKTKIMLFNDATHNDFMPEMTINYVEFFEVVEEIKLLGVMITSDLKWQKKYRIHNQEEICQTLAAEETETAWS